VFLAGDAAISCRDGAKGLNLAVADVRMLARAFTNILHTGAAATRSLFRDLLKRV